MRTQRAEFSQAAVGRAFLPVPGWLNQPKANGQKIFHFSFAIAGIESSGEANEK
jgi:hypothetical protein